MIPPLHYRAETVTTFLDAHTWHPDRPTRVLVVNKNDFADHFWVELPAQWVFHYGNAWEDEQGVIRFDAARAPDPLAMFDTFRELMRGNIVPGSPSQHHQYRLDTRARSISEAPLFSPMIDSEFPCVDPRVSGRRYQRLVMLSSDRRQPAVHGGLNEVSSLNLDDGTRQVFRYPEGQTPEEHLYVPAMDQAPETGGWIVGTALDWRSGHSLLNVFDADHVADGPLASATLPYVLPLGLHGKFVHG